MSLERAALRLAAVMALSNGFGGPYPTMAQDRVYDSRQDPIQGLSPGDIVPTIILYTDSDHGASMSANNGGPPFIHTVNLVIELTLGVAEQADDDSLSITLPFTEPELDAALDAFEAQVSRVFRDQAGIWGEHLGRMLRRVETWNSERFVDREANIRLASRQITATIALVQEQEQMLGDANTPYIPAPYGPLLAAVASSGGPYAATADAIQNMILSGAPDRLLVLPMLERVRFIEADQSQTNPAGVAAGPRASGVAEAVFPAA